MGTHHRIKAQFGEASSQKIVVGVVNLAGSAGHTGCDQLVTGGDQGYPHFAVDLYRRDARTGQNADIHRIQLLASVHQRRTCGIVLAAEAIVLMFAQGCVDLHLLLAVVGVLLTDDTVGTCGDGGARHDAHRRTRRDRLAGHAARHHAVNDPQRHGLVFRCPHRVGSHQCVAVQR